MPAEASPQRENIAGIPADDSKRAASTTASESGQHIGIVGDTYTILVSGKDTAGRFCLVDMFVPPRRRTTTSPSRFRRDFQSSGRRARSGFSRRKAEIESRGDREHSGERAASVPQFVEPTGAHALHLFAGRPGGVLSRAWNSGCDANYASARIGREGPSSVSRKGPSSRTEISHGVIASHLIARSE